MSLLSGKNITKALITLIIIFGIIFIIVGERPRHKSQPETKATPATADSTTPEKLPTPVTLPEEVTSNTVSTEDSDTEKAPEAVTPESTDAEIDQTITDYSAKNNTDTELTQEGIEVNAPLITMDEASADNIQKEEDTDKESVDTLTDLSEPVLNEESDINPAILKERELENKHPLLYTTMTAAGTNTVYAINTSTAEVAVLVDDNTYWINLGKPDDATEKPASTYILEGATKDSAVVMDTATAQAWRVTFSNDNINWSLIQPFADNNK